MKRNLKADLAENIFDAITALIIDYEVDYGEIYN
jgi:hypothetical protein